MKFFHSIKFKFTLWYLVVLGLALGALSTGAYFYLYRTLHQNLDDSLMLRATQMPNIRDVLTSMSSDARVVQDPNFSAQLQSITESQFNEEIGEVIYLYVQTEQELIFLTPNDKSDPVGLDLVPQAMNGESSFATVETANGKELRIYATPFFLQPPPFMIMTDKDGNVSPATPDTGNISAALIIGRPTEDINQALAGLIRTFMITVPLTLAAAGSGGVFLARRALKPVDEITKKAQKIEESDLSQRINVKTKDELGRLASTLNQMIERLEKAFRRQQEFTSDASHELRAPLAVIQAESTLSLKKERSADEYQRSLESIALEAERMSAVISQMLDLARADAGKEPLVFEEIDLNELITDLSSDIEILCRDKGLGFQLDYKDSLRINGSRGKLRSLFLNLLDNAIRYTPGGGKISVSIHREEQMAVVSVVDTGVGIPEEELPLIFERFYRVDRARSRSEGGSGLGLAIAQHIAKAHRGRIEAESRFGEGSIFRVWLPLSHDA